MTEIPPNPNNPPPIRSVESAFRAPTRETWALPSKTTFVVGPAKLTPGLHLLAAPKATGKTVTTLALAINYRQAGVPTVFAYVMEPRAQDVRSILAVGEWQKYVESCLLQARNGLLVLDSLTYVLNRLDIITELEDAIGKVTYAGGLTPRDILSVLALDDMARKGNVALIGTLNSELFPIADKLEGACEGAITLSGDGQFLSRSRKARVVESYSIPREFVEAARTELGYPVVVNMFGELA